MDRQRARAFWVAAPGRGEIRDEALGAVGAADVLVRTAYSGISRGTEALVFHGRVPESERQRMAAPFQAGRFPAPVKYGYASVGIVEEGPADLRGKSVFTLFPHQTAYVVPAAAVHLLPRDVPAARAVLAANMETAINGVWDASIRPGDRVTVIGGGTVGCLVAWLAGRMPSCDVTLVDINPSRATVARALDVGFAAPGDAPRDADVVVHASGSPAGLDLSLRCAGFEAIVVEMSWYGDQPVDLRLGEAFHARRLTIKSSQVGHVAAAQRSRWDSRRRMQLALAMLADPSLDVLMTGESGFEELPAVMPQLASNPGDAIFHRVRYDGASDAAATPTIR
jgi:2-desacetyl-2-hydroxyethyl bacteriochlorophyllide A dehydrogenase